MAEKKEPTAADVLRRMKSLLRKGWTQRVSARSVSGRQVRSDSPRAVSFCLLGAECRAVNELRSALGAGFSAEGFLRDCVSEHSGLGNIVAFNDKTGRTKKEILDVVGCAIKKAASA